MRRFLPVFWLALAAGAQEEDPVAFAVGGVVVDERGEPVAGVAVLAWDALEKERYLGQGATGAKGRFLVALRASTLKRREHPFGPVRVVVRGKGIAQARVAAAPGARDLRLEVAQARAIQGVVRDAEGEPVPAAIVQGRRAGEVWEETTTDAEGRFALTQFSGRVEIRAVSDALVHATVPAAPGKEVEIRLPPARARSGRVLDAETKEPIADARLLKGAVVAAVADAAGRFTVQAGAAFAVHAPGYVVATWETGEISLRPAAPLRGRVVDAGDRAVEGCRVTAGQELVTYTDDRGGYAFEVVPTGLVRLTASLPGYLPVSVRVVASQADRVTLRLLRGAQVAGRVVRDEQPAVGARVSVRAPRRRTVGTAHVAGETEVAFGYADARGRFLVAGVPLGATRLVAVADGWSSGGVALRGLEDGQRAGPLRAELKDHLVLRGTLASDAGGPLAAVLVRCGDRTTKTDAAGRFAFDALPVQSYELLAEPPDHVALRVACRPGDRLGIVATSRFGDLAIAVDVAGPAAADVVLRRREPPRVSRQAAWRGERVRFAGLPGGMYDLVVTAPGFLESRRSVAPRAEPFMVTLQRGGTLELLANKDAKVLVQTLSGKPAPIAVLELAGGAKELRDFGPGKYRFIGRAPGELIVVREVALGPSDPPRTVDLRGGRESTLTVHVKNEVGEPLDDAEIRLRTEGGFVWNTRRRTDATGRATLDRLIAGRLHVRAVRGNRVGEAALDVVPGKALELTVEVR